MLKPLESLHALDHKPLALGVVYQKTVRIDQIAHQPALLDVNLDYILSSFTPLSKTSMT